MSGLYSLPATEPPQHRIVTVANDDNLVFWRCGCGEDATGYADVAEARLAAADHLLDPDALGTDAPMSVEEWRDWVADDAERAAEAEPGAWRWWRHTATGADWITEEN